MLTVPIEFFDIEELQGVNKICCDASKRWIAQNFGTTNIHLKEVHDTLMKGDLPSDTDYGDDSGVVAWQKGSLQYVNSLNALKAASKTVFATNDYRIVHNGIKYYFTSITAAKEKQQEILDSYISTFEPHIYAYTEEVNSLGTVTKHIHTYDSSINSMHSDEYKFIIKYPDESTYTSFNTIEEVHAHSKTRRQEYITNLSRYTGIISQRISCTDDDFFDIWVKYTDIETALAD